jgi:Ca-activated chloride channel family protein
MEVCFADLPTLRGPAGEARFAAAEDAVAAEPRRLIVAVDASGSMAGRVTGEIKMDAAKEAALAFLSEAPEGVEVGLIAFGHTGNNEESGKVESCRGVETFYKVGTADRKEIETALTSFEPKGWTPLAAAIEAAGEAFVASNIPGEQVVYVVSDGEETCGGDPVAAARQLYTSDVKAVINVIGFDLADADRAQLEAVAQAGGGAFANASDPNALRNIGREIARNAHNVREIVSQRAQGARAEVANSAATARTVVKARACFARRSVQEKAGVARHIGFRGPPEIRAGISERLKQRHDDYEARIDAYVEGAEAARDAANMDIDEVREDAEDAYRDVAPD